MIIDRITLNMALKYLIRLHENEGEITDILFTSKDQISDSSKSAKFPDIPTLITFINTYAPVTAFESLDCNISRMFQLRSFNISKVNANKNKVYMDADGFKTISLNIGKVSIKNLNDEYIPLINSARELFNKIDINEYILEQYRYIDCGYINIYDPAVVESIKTMYNKYKQI